LNVCDSRAIGSGGSYQRPLCQISKYWASSRRSSTLSGSPKRNTLGVAGLFLGLIGQGQGGQAGFGHIGPVS
jgi:hypothetical protein